MSGGRNTLGHDLVKGWGWLDPFANFFGAIMGGFYKLPGTRPIKDLLHGTWPLHHPFHPAVTDLTIGGYTAMVAVDALSVVTGEPGLARAADFLLVFSLITSLGSILSGLTDWNETYDTERRTGTSNAASGSSSMPGASTISPTPPNCRGDWGPQPSRPK